MTGPQRKKRTYWIADMVTPVLKDRALLLNQKGFDVQFFTSLDALITELASKRASVIVVSDDGDERVTESILHALMGLPEIQGARLIMVRNTHSDRINFLAACANFRDIIPSNLDERLWLTRFIYATAGRSMQYVQPAGQITLNNISAVSLPARLTWMNEKRLRFECRVRPPVGTTLNLTGGLALAAGVSHISLKVVETQRSHLLYRFSDAVIAEWSVPAGAREKMLQTLTELRRQDPGPRCRVFVAAQSSELRAEILTRFSDPRFEVSTALQKQSIVDEPKFFTPHLVLIEAALCLEENGERFDAMMDNLTEQAAVAILGRMPGIDMVLRRHLGRRILQLPKVPKNLSQSIISHYLPQREPPRVEDGAHIIAEHPWSLAEVTFPARLHKIHPLAAQIAMPFPVGNFALARLDSPLVRKMLGRNPYVKLTATYQDTHPDAPPFIHLADCYLADLDQAERTSMVASLTRLITESLVRLDPGGSFGGSQARGETRTPELGSVRTAPAHRVPRAPAQDASEGPVVAAPPAATMGAVALNLDALDEPGQVDERLAIEQIAELVKINAAKPKVAPPPPPVEEPEKDGPSWEPVRVKKGVRTNPLSAAQILGAVAVVAFVLALFWALFTGLASHMSKSGGVYTDQIKKFAPQLSDP